MKISALFRAISSAGSEHLVYTEGVGGSNPSLPTIRDKEEKFFFVLFLFEKFFSSLTESKTNTSSYLSKTFHR